MILVYSYLDVKGSLPYKVDQKTGSRPEKLNVARNTLQRAEGISQAIAVIKAYLAQNPVPDKRTLDELKASQQKIVQLQADRDAASMTLRVIPGEGAIPAEVALDGALPAVAKLADTAGVVSAAEGGIAHTRLGSRGTESRDKQRRPRSNRG